MRHFRNTPLVHPQIVQLFSEPGFPYHWEEEKVITLSKAVENKNFP